MFSSDIVDSDKFLDLPFTSQLLYFHLGMHGDVKGFVQPKKITRSVGLKIEDLKPLILEGFVIPFESGVVVITHWNINNSTREDREAPTIYAEELSRLSRSDRQYTLLQENSRSTPAQYSIVESSIVEDRVGEATDDNQPLEESYSVVNEPLTQEGLDTASKLAVESLGNQVNSIIALFEPVNPSFSRLFANKTERSAAERLIKQHTLEKLKKLMELLPDIVNMPFAPRITTPLQLEKDLGKLQIFMAQAQGVKSQKRGGVYDATGN